MTTYTGTTGDDILASTNTGPTSTGNDTMTGLAGDDMLVGGIGNDTLDGGSGSNILVGGVGSDVYLVSSALDQIIENPNEGTDTVITSVSFSLAPFDNVENITAKTSTVTGVGIALTGNDGDNVLDGSLAAATNVLTGGAGNDTFILGAGDTIVENANEGTDTVQASININLASYANVENATLTGTAISLTGTTGANVLIGNAGNNIISDGGFGSADSMVGGAGNDTYSVNNAGDVITDASGTDLVNFTSLTSGVTYTLGTGVENLALQGSNDINGTGNTLANVITGNAGNNTLDGGAGADTLNGGLGNDTYVVDVAGTAGDKITDTGGTDTVIFNGTTNGTTYVLAAGFENLQLSLLSSSTTALNGTGNTGANMLTGNSGANILSDGGAAAVDNMTGGAGNDTYMVNNAGDVITELSSEGTDEVIFLGTTAGSTYTLGANVENLLLGATITSSAAINGTGNALANLIEGNAAANVLNDGGVGGNDSLVGGAGNDTYIVNNTGDVIVDSAGTDTVNFVTHANGASYTLSSGLENITLTGGFASSATGNSGNNQMIGDAGDNTFIGGGGTDIMKGGDGNDTYTVDSTTDIVAELNTVSSGTADTVIFNGTGLTGSVTYTLTPYVENLILGGVANINGNGNAHDNVIEGNSGNNILNGSGGTDTVSYQNAASGVTVSLALTTSQDTVGAGHDTLSNFENLTGSTHDDTLTGSSGDNLINGGGGFDDLTGGAGHDTFAITAAPGASNVATIHDFDATATTGDVLDISSVLTGYTSGSLAGFVEFVTTGSDTQVSVDAAGGGNYTLVATLTGVTGLDGTEDALATAGILVG